MSNEDFSVEEYLQRFREGLTEYCGTISSDHAYIHQGKAWTAIINTGSISAAYNIGFTTPLSSSNKFAHWRPIGIDSSAEYVDIVLYEGDSFSGGTTVTPINRNREGFSSASSNMQTFSKGVTATPVGTIIQRTGIGISGNPVSKSGGGAAADQEIVLKSNTDYVIVLTPDAATICNLSLFWYEEGGYLG